MTYMQSLIQGLIQNIAIYAVITNVVIYLLYWGWKLCQMILKNQTQLQYRMLKGIVLASAIPTFYLVFCKYHCVQSLHSMICDLLGVGEPTGYAAYEYTKLPFDVFLWLYFGVSFAITVIGVARRLFLCAKEQQFVDVSTITTRYEDTLLECKKLIDCHAKVEIYMHPYVPGPCVLHYRGKYRILLFEYDYSEQDIRTVLLHELGHIKNRDCYWKKAIMWMQILCPLCPAVYLLAQAYDEYCELNCDITTCGIYGKTRDYFGIVLDLAKYVSDHNQLRLYPSFCKNANDVKLRVSHMQSYQKRGNTKRIWLHNLMQHCGFVVVLCGLAITLGLSNWVDVVYAGEIETGPVQESSENRNLLCEEHNQEAMQYLNIGDLDCYTGYEESFACVYMDETLFHGYSNSVMLARGGILKLEPVHVEVGDEITFAIGGDDDNNCYAMGILSEDGTLRYINQLDEQNNIFVHITAEKEEDLQLIIVNLGSSDLALSASVRLAYSGTEN